MIEFIITISEQENIEFIEIILYYLIDKVYIKIIDNSIL